MERLFVPVVLALSLLSLVTIALAAFRLARAWPGGPRSRWAAVAALALAAGVVLLGVYAAIIEPRSLVVNEITITSADWHGEPLRIAAIGDTHVGGPHVDIARMQSVVRQINGLAPDLIVLLGDYETDDKPERRRTAAQRKYILDGVAVFAGLRARYGVVGVIGNHDTWYGRQSIATALEQAGVTVLWNANAVIHRQGESDFVIAGIADAMTGYPNFSTALDGAPAGADTLVISHSPDPFADMPRGPALMLAAHSHCGQVTVPFVGRPILPITHAKYACHLVQEDDKVLYVTGGIGTSRIPVRFLNPPEIAVVTLRGVPGAVAHSP